MADENWRNEYEKGLYITVNGQLEKENDADEEVGPTIPDVSLTKERLASKPIKYVTSSQRYLSVSFDLKEDHLTMKQQGVDAHKLPEVKKSPEICRNRIETTLTSESR